MKMDVIEMEKADVFYDSCRKRALQEFNSVLEQSLELSTDVLDALVENQLISGHLQDMLSGSSLDNEAKVHGVLFNIKINMTEDKFNRFLNVIENNGLRHIAKAIWKSYSNRANAYEPKMKHVGSQTENSVPTKLPIKERQKLCKMYDKLKNGVKSRHSRHVQFDDPKSSPPDENTIRLEDVDGQIDKVLGMFHEQIHYIAKFCEKLGLVGHELPTISREIEKLVSKCKSLEAKVSRMSVNELFSQYLKEETSASSFSSAIQRGKTSDYSAVRTSSPKPILDPQTNPSAKVSSSELTDVAEPSDLKKDGQDNDYLSSIHPKIKQKSRRTVIRNEYIRTSDIIQKHLTPFERDILEPGNKESVQTSPRRPNLNMKRNRQSFQFGTELKGSVWSTGTSQPPNPSRRPHRQFQFHGMPVTRE